ncbi:hypothetical protein [Kordia zhangzhouensis]|uniref:hypothetical protein n=1 Tax=Kordia zhangzhouensis TaxID=1620405 RepID=UPI0006295892|nr:hypothetical protein [Kordia zhangzhouensis]
MNQHATWSLFQKIGFRFFFSYAILSIFPFPINSFTFLYNIINWFNVSVWGNIVPFFGRLFFELDIASEQSFTGSGDTTYYYVLTFSHLIIAIIATLIWSILDRKRKHYVHLLKFLVIYIAYYVMYAMFSYGSYKIIPL